MLQIAILVMTANTSLKRLGEEAELLFLFLLSLKCFRIPIQNSKVLEDDSR